MTNLMKKLKMGFVVSIQKQISLAVNQMQAWSELQREEPGQMWKGEN